MVKKFLLNLRRISDAQQLMQISLKEEDGLLVYFEETFGAFKDDPLVIDSEGIFEDEEEFN
jgi:hypothetical protein